MKLIIDLREQSLFENCIELLSLTSDKTYKSILIEKRILNLGDVLITSDDEIETYCIIERKTIADLLASIKDGRYEEQSHRLIYSTDIPSHNIIYVIEGYLTTLRTPTEIKTVNSAIISLSLFKKFTVMRTTSISETAELLLSIVTKIEKNKEKGIFLKKSQEQDKPDTGSNEIKNYSSVVKSIKKDNITPENIGEIMLCQIPSISSVTAIAIMKKFNTINNLILTLRSNENCLDDIVCESKGKTRKISKNCVENIKKYLLHIENTV